MGDTLARAISTAVLCVAVLFVAWLTIEWIDPTNARAALAVGSWWLGLTLAFEFLVGHYVLHKPWATLLADYDVTRGRIWVAALIVTLLAPLWAGRWRGLFRSGQLVALTVGALIGLVSCTPRKPSMGHVNLTDFATQYAAAWSSQNPGKLASFYAQNGSLTVNGGVAAGGREAITAKARGFMEAFPDMVVRLDSLTGSGTHPIFHWTWTGTNSGPGGTGREVRLSG